VGTDAVVWPCPICEAALTVVPYKGGNGFKLTCFGSAGSAPHYIRIYLDHYEAGADFLPVVPAAKDSVGKKTRARDLLARAQSIGEGGGNVGSEASSKER
jgi:hypothetical protein